MAQLKFFRFDGADDIDSAADAEIALNVGLEELHPGDFASAIGDIARVFGMAKVAKVTGISREALYRSFSFRGNPELATLFKVLAALGVSLTAKVDAGALRKNGVLTAAAARRLPAQNAARRDTVVRVIETSDSPRPRKREGGKVVAKRVAAPQAAARRPAVVAKPRARSR